MSDETIEAEAEVIDVPSVMGAADLWLSDVTGRVGSLMGKYGTHPIESDADYRDIKNARMMIRKDIAAIDAERKAKVKSLQDALTQFRGRCSIALQPLVDREAEYKGLIDGWDAGWRQRRMDYVRNAYEEYAPALVDLVPLEVIQRRYAQDDKWMLRSVTDEGAADAMRRRVDQIAKEWATLDNLDLTDEERAQAKSDYTRTLDLGEIVRKVTEDRERRERVARIEAGQGRQAEMPAPEPEPETEAEPTATYRFEVTCTKAQLDGLMAYLRANGIHGRRCSA